jgi:hypothetical protein
MFGQDWDYDARLKNSDAWRRDSVMKVIYDNLYPGSLL